MKMKHVNRLWEPVLRKKNFFFHHEPRKYLFFSAITKIAVVETLRPPRKKRRRWLSNISENSASLDKTSSFLSFLVSLFLSRFSIWIGPTCLSYTSSMTLIACASWLIIHFEHLIVDRAILSMFALKRWSGPNYRRSRWSIIRFRHVAL